MQQLSGKKQNSFRLVVFLLLLSAIMIASACAGQSSDRNVTEEQPEEEISYVDTKDSTACSAQNSVDISETAETVEQTSDSLAAELELSELVEQSALIVQGQVASQSEEFYIQPVFDGTAMGYLDYTVRIAEVHRGETDKGVITVRIPTASNIALEEGQDVLLFLYPPAMGGGYNTEGDYYYITGAQQGIYLVQESENGTVFWNRFGNVRETAASFLEEIMALSAEYPVNDRYNYDTFLENAQRNLDNGVITREEYDRYLAELEEYAVILPSEEQ